MNNRNTVQDLGRTKTTAAGALLGAALAVTGCAAPGATIAPGAPMACGQEPSETGYLALSVRSPRRVDHIQLVRRDERDDGGTRAGARGDLSLYGLDAGGDIRMLRADDGTYCMRSITVGGATEVEHDQERQRCFELRAGELAIPGELVVRLTPGDSAGFIKTAWAPPDDRLMHEVWATWPALFDRERQLAVRVSSGLR